MRLTRVLRTSTFRTALFYLALFSASGVGILAYIYWRTAGVLESQTNDSISGEIVELADQYRGAGLTGLVDSIAERSSGRYGRNHLYLLTDFDFRPVAGNLAGWPKEQPDREGWLDFEITYPETLGAESQPARARVFVLPGDIHLLVGRGMSERVAFQKVIEDSLLGALLVTLALGLTGGAVMSRKLLRQVDSVNRTAQEILQGDLSRRIPIRGSNDEFDQLAQNLNAMLDRIQRLVAGMREVTENVAHELRSPLARLRSRLELALLGKPDTEEYRTALQRAISETEGVLNTFNALLSIAQIESGVVQESMEPLDMESLVRDLAELYGPILEDKGLSLATDLESCHPVRGNRHLLSQALANLLDNAVKYTPPGGTVSLALSEGGQGVRLVVADTGPGIPPESRRTVLKRFTRLEASRHTPGTGLGLSLVAAVADLHGARLLLEDNEPGLRVRLEFPPSR